MPFICLLWPKTQLFHICGPRIKNGYLIAFSSIALFLHSDFVGIDFYLVLRTQQTFSEHLLCVRHHSREVYYFSLRKIIILFIILWENSILSFVFSVPKLCSILELAQIGSCSYHWLFPAVLVRGLAQPKVASSSSVPPNGEYRLLSSCGWKILLLSDRALLLCGANLLSCGVPGSN